MNELDSLRYYKKKIAHVSGPNGGNERPREGICVLPKVIKIQDRCPRTSFQSKTPLGLCDGFPLESTSGPKESTFHNTRPGSLVEVLLIILRLRETFSSIDVEIHSKKAQQSDFILTL